jgi:hypothetical protein
MGVYSRQKKVALVSKHQSKMSTLGTEVNVLLPLVMLQTSWSVPAQHRSTAILQLHNFPEQRHACHTHLGQFA